MTLALYVRLSAGDAALFAACLAGGFALEGLVAAGWMLRVGAASRSIQPATPRRVKLTHLSLHAASY